MYHIIADHSSTTIPQILGSLEEVLKIDLGTGVCDNQYYRKYLLFSFSSVTFSDIATIASLEEADS